VAKAAVRLKRRRNRRRGSTGLPRGFVMGIVLLVCTGLIAWYFRAALDGTTATPAAAGTAETEAREPSRGKTPAKSPRKDSRAGDAQPAADGDSSAAAAAAADRFEFYDMLPDAEVDVAEQPKESGAGGPPPVSVPGTYVVQAGAFPNFAEADKVKARLALLGIVSEIQAADANGAQFHRVRIGPIDNLNELNRLRALLRQKGIEYLVIPVGE
jgi:cell division protein FtsN